MDSNKIARSVYNSYLNGVSLEELKVLYDINNPEQMIKIMHYATEELRDIIIGAIGVNPAYKLVRVSPDNQIKLFNLVNGVKCNKTSIIDNEIKRCNMPVTRLNLPSISIRNKSLKEITLDIINIINEKVSMTDFTFDDVYVNIPKVIKRLNIDVKE